MSFEQKMSIVKRELARLRRNGVLIHVNDKTRVALVRKNLGIRLLGSVDALKNLGQYRVTFQ